MYKNVGRVVMFQTKIWIHFTKMEVTFSSVRTINVEINCVPYLKFSRNFTSW